MQQAQSAPGDGEDARVPIAVRGRWRDDLIGARSHARGTCGPSPLGADLVDHDGRSSVHVDEDSETGGLFDEFGCENEIPEVAGLGVLGLGESFGGDGGDGGGAV